MGAGRRAAHRYRIEAFARDRQIEQILRRQGRPARTPGQLELNGTDPVKGAVYDLGADESIGAYAG